LILSLAGHLQVREFVFNEIGHIASPSISRGSCSKTDGFCFSTPHWCIEATRVSLARAPAHGLQPNALARL
jgi:hypothetical protein